MNPIYVPFVGEIINQTMSRVSQPYREVMSGISEVRLESIDEILFLQKQTYHDVHERRNSKCVLESYISASIAKAIYDTKPQLSYEYRDKNMKLVGFVLSLIGDAEHTKSKRFVEPLKKYATHTACIYVSDWCTFQKTAIGGLLLKRFFSDYTRFYLEDNNLPAIVGDHRLSTSFGLIKRGLRLIEKIIDTERHCNGISSSVHLQRLVGRLRVMGDEQRSVLLVPKITAI